MQAIFIFIDLDIHAWRGGQSPFSRNNNNKKNNKQKMIWKSKNKDHFKI